MTSTAMIVFSYHIHDDYPCVEMRMRSELTPQHMTDRLAGAVDSLRAGTADPTVTWGMMSALVTAYEVAALPTGPDAPHLLEELRSLCFATT